jgi:hypothetical protein
VTEVEFKPLIILRKIVPCSFHYNISLILEIDCSVPAICPGPTKSFGVASGWSQLPPHSFAGSLSQNPCSFFNQKQLEAIYVQEGINKKLIAPP